MHYVIKKNVFQDWEKKLTFYSKDFLDLLICSSTSLFVMYYIPVKMNAAIP